MPSSKAYLRSVSAVWYERLNFANKFKKFCQWCTGKFEFWCLVGLCTLLEPILCSKWPEGNVLLAQVICLAASSFLYVIQLIGVASREWEKIIMIEAMSSLQSLAIPKHMMDLSLLKIFIFFAAEGEYILEFVCILGGWILIFWHPGLAALRCFRTFRLLWFYEVEIFRSSTELYFNPIFGEVFVSRGFRVLKFAIKSLSALGNEMFRLTADTKGGLLLMMIFFYSAFVLGTSLWIETNADATYCLTLGSCMYTLMRLTFFDGTGFDFAYSLTSKHKILFFIVLMYMCLTSFGILNGLVGIFGTAFARASDLAFEDEEDRMAANEANNAAVKANSRNNLYADEDDADEDPNKGKEAEKQEEKKVAGASRLNLKGFMGGGSRAQNVVKSSESPSPDKDAQGNARLTMKELVKMNRNKKSNAATYPFEPVPTSELGSPAPNEERVKPSEAGGRRPPAMGMFAKQMSMKSPAAPALGGSQASLQTNNQMNTLTSNVNNLQKKLEKQNELMTNMFEHILFLQQQLAVVHPELANMSQRPAIVEQHLSKTSSPEFDSFLTTPQDSPGRNNRMKVQLESVKSMDEDVHSFNEDKDGLA